MNLNSPIQKAKLFVKWILFPGIDLHARCRYKYLSTYLKEGPIDTIDAGCGNGLLSYAAYKLGNKVLGLTINAAEVENANALFSRYINDPERLEFRHFNLYDLPKLNQRFDQIICSECLEHIKRDDLIIQYFYDLLKPDGILHLCCPNELHPDHQQGRQDAPEDGGHVRDGYTLESYRRLLETRGFKIVESAGLAGTFYNRLHKIIRWIRHHFGNMVAIPFYLLSVPFHKLDDLNPTMPFSLYVKAVKIDLCETEKGAGKAPG